MSTLTATELVDRRSSVQQVPARHERRQFAENRDYMPEEVRELADAIDAYKMEHGRRYITLAEVLEVVKSLGYRRW